MAFRGRPVSPSGTSYSGISNYRSESYRPMREQEIPAVPQIDAKRIARIHWEELRTFLAAHLAKEEPNSRSNAREKLNRLTRQQFQELSTDVYDELVRRVSRDDMPHLPTREDFHPRRNQARKKLSTLPKARFKDLASDVYYELSRRYPEFVEPENGPDTPGSNYNDYPPSPNPPQEPPRPSQDTYRRPTPDSSYQAGPSGRQTGYRSEGRPSQDQQLYGRRSEDSGPTPIRRPSGNSRDAESAYTPSMGRPNDSVYRNSRRPSDAGPPGPATATSGMVIPVKSTIAEEEIQVPYGRDDFRDSDQSAAIRTSVASALTDIEDDGPSPLPHVGGLSALGNSNWNKGFDQGRPGSPQSDEEKTSKQVFGFSTLRNQIAGGDDLQNAAKREANEREKRELQTKAEALQGRVSALEEEIVGHQKTRKSDQDRIRQLNDDIEALKRNLNEHGDALRTAQRELAEERRQKNQRDQAAHSEEVQRLRRRCEELERETKSLKSKGGDTDAIDDLKVGMSNLLEEVKELSGRNDELLAEKDDDLATIRDLEAQVDDFRKKYERAKTELRGLKATSQLFLQPQTKTDDQLPTSNNGGILDIHITAFQSAADTLLTAGRSNAPSRVLMPMKDLVEAVTAMVDDARSYDIRSRGDVDFETVSTLCDRAEATLSNLVTASKTHATSYGLSPVSLLDAALSHVSAAVTELAKLLLIKRSTTSERDAAFTPAERNNLKQDNWNGVRKNGYRPNPLGGNGLKDISDQSGSNMSSPTALFDTTSARKNGQSSDEMDGSWEEVRGTKESWEDLKPFLDNQSELLVQAIQGVLASVRSQAPSPTLNENLTQIITTVSSIVAICRDSLPSNSRKQGMDILSKLSEHCNKLSEVQAQPSMTKESRQVMAQSSFAIANVIKDLMRL